MDGSARWKLEKQVEDGIKKIDENNLSGVFNLTLLTYPSTHYLANDVRHSKLNGRSIRTKHKSSPSIMAGNPSESFSSVGCTGRKWLALETMNQTESILKLKDIVGMTATGRQGIGAT